MGARRRRSEKARSAIGRQVLPSRRTWARSPPASDVRVCTRSEKVGTVRWYRCGLAVRAADLGVEEEAADEGEPAHIADVLLERWDPGDHLGMGRGPPPRPP